MQDSSAKKAEKRNQEAIKSNFPNGCKIIREFKNDDKL